MAGISRCWEGSGEQAFKGGLPPTTHITDAGHGWAAVSHFQPASLPGPAGPLPVKDLINPELLGEALAPIAGHFSGERSPTGRSQHVRPPSNHSSWSKAHLWPMEALPAQAKLQVPAEVSLQLWDQPDGGRAFPCRIYPLGFRVFSLGSLW